MSQAKITSQVEFNWSGLIQPRSPPPLLFSQRNQCAKGGS